MGILVALQHRTSYRFERPVQLGAHLIRLRPAAHTRTPIESYALRVEPAGHFLNWQQDPFGNHVARVSFPDRVQELDVTVELTADLTVINPFDFFIDEQAERFPFSYDERLATDLAPYRQPVASDRLAGWLADLPTAGTGTVDFLATLNRHVAGTVAYTVRMEPGVQSPDSSLQRAIGSCRDSAWLLVAALRACGLAARFVSGYLIQLAPDRPDEGSTLTGDFTDLHAWAEAYVPGAGWIGLDGTSGLFAGEGHIPLSATPDPAESAPITGTTESAASTMSYSNTVRRVRERSRVTKPYDDEQWAAVRELGERVDAQLAADDTRLTMGGEPTFVSVTDMASPQWTVAADGTDKRAIAGRLADRLRRHYAPDGVVHHGQGKWYPGEPLPRWQIAITWRTDGTPLWPDPELLADPLTPVSAPVPAEAAERFVRRVAAAFAMPEDVVLPAYEDVLAKLAAEARLPAGAPPVLDPAQPPDDRAALVADLDADVGAPAGWVLPLHRTEDGGGWGTTRWRTRRGRLVLLGGTSPVGLRLPIEAISWTPAPARPERAMFSVDEPLTRPGRPAPATVTPVKDAPTTALAAEVRDGRLFVFLPPVDDFADAVELLAVLAQSAADIATAVVLEGYPLPGDPRTRTLTVTPDPGVIEVNVHPAASFAELTEITETLHAAAHDVGLGTEKFALDGTHTGTGGGSHLTLGGATPADSPLLRRPDLLVSMLSYWQRHPALSYLFSGRFIGPTSQAPRVDEARHESLYELEIAFAELRRAGVDARPWTVDRALRHLLVDLTGNTHRAEFCIDKLFSPDSARGRLGLLELRGFEMPPHEQLSLVQALLVRALVARFWRDPYTADLMRWGMQLHDRYLLPAFVRADIADVAADLRAHGLPFRTEWLDPFLEFRFPVLGTARLGSAELELRAAIEPWHVLGEEATAGGTARYVDSSLERLQVSLRDSVPGRHVLACNGIAVPLHADPSGTAALVAGVRYRAWAPPSALHPTIGIHAPLVFELIDTWSDTSLGGCTYHVVHPGGRAYDTFPVNANEAEARRAARFTPGGAIPGTAERVRAHRPQPTAELAYTLDLRRSDQAR